MAQYPRRRRITRPVEDYVLEMFSPDEVAGLPPELAAMVDLRGDQDIEYVADSLKLMKMAGLDVDHPDIFQLAIDAGHHRAALVNDDTELLSQQRAERERERADARRWFSERKPTSVVVYYMRLGPLVKIGFTLDIGQRMMQINPEELLVTEPGGIKREAERHRQFASLRVHSEWFRYEGELVKHVAELQRRAA